MQKYLHNSTYPNNSDDALDTLAQLGTNHPLGKRARAKYFAIPLSVSLASLQSPLEKSYRNTVYCAQNLLQQGQKITGNYCNNRWCPVCNRIRTAKLINGYKLPLSKLNDKYFVTLTLPNCKAEELRPTIDSMLLVCKAIQEFFKRRNQRDKQDWQLVGIRKLECTYNHISDSFHPHFHFIIDGYDAANGLLSEWLKRVPTADARAQDVKKAKEGVEIELFKYFAKIVTKVGKGDFRTFAKPLDIIFQSMKGLRVFQPIGIKKDVSEDIEEIVAEEFEDLESVEVANWTWFKNDWVQVDTGEILTGYVPSEAMEKLIEGIVSD
jgi:hypothetical protein